MKKTFVYDGKEILEKYPHRGSYTDYHILVKEMELEEIVRNMPLEVRAHMMAKAYPIYKALEVMGRSPSDYIDDEEILVFIMEKGIRDAVHLRKKEIGLWQAARERGSLDDIFAKIALERFNVGSTPLIEFDGREYGLEKIFVKDESKNHFGTFKDRKALYIANLAYRKNIWDMQAISSGNFGFSLANFGNAVGIRTSLIVPHNLESRIYDALEKVAVLIGVNLDEEFLTDEKMLEIGSEKVDLGGRKVLQATNFYDDAYFSIFREIDESLQAGRKKPEYVIVPGGGFELAAAACRYYLDSGTKVLVASTDNSDTQATMLYAKYRPMLDFMKESIPPNKYEIIWADEREISAAGNWAKQKGINSEPSAAAAFAALQRYSFKPSDVVVVVNTGNGTKNFIK